MKNSLEKREYKSDKKTEFSPMQRNFISSMVKLLLEGISKKSGEITKDSRKRHGKKRTPNKNNIEKEILNPLTDMNIIKYDEKSDEVYMTANGIEKVEFIDSLRKEKTDKNKRSGCHVLKEVYLKIKETVNTCCKLISIVNDENCKNIAVKFIGVIFYNKTATPLNESEKLALNDYAVAGDQAVRMYDILESGKGTIKIHSSILGKQFTLMLKFIQNPNSKLDSFSVDIRQIDDFLGTTKK